MEFTLLIGPPGAGKSHMMRHALADVRAIGHAHKPVTHALYGPYQVQLGDVTARAGMFPGTDRLAMNAGPKVLQWLAGREWYRPDAVVVAEGARLMYPNFLETMHDNCWHITLAHVDPGFSVCASRCVARGSDQAPSWIKAQRTKIDNLLLWWDAWREGKERTDYQVVHTVDDLRTVGGVSDILSTHSPTHSV